MYQFKYTYSNGVEEFSRIFSLEEIEQGLQFDEISDSPLLKDFKIIDRKLLKEEFLPDNIAYYFGTK